MGRKRALCGTTKTDSKVIQRSGKSRDIWGKTVCDMELLTDKGAPLMGREMVATETGVRERRRLVVQTRVEGRRSSWDDSGSEDGE